MKPIIRWALVTMAIIWLIAMVVKDYRYHRHRAPSGPDPAIAHAIANRTVNADIDLGTVTYASLCRMLNNSGVRSDDNHGDLAITHVDWAGVLSADFSADGPIENKNPLALECYAPIGPHDAGFLGTLHGIHRGEPVGDFLET